MFARAIRRLLPAAAVAVSAWQHVCGTENARRKLQETPEHPSLEVARSLHALSFRCAECGTPIIPPDGVQRITVRPTPIKGSEDVVMATGIFTERATNITYSENRRPFHVHQTDFAEQPYLRQVFCAGCKKQVGYRLEDGHGEPMWGNRGRPPFKFWYESTSDTSAQITKPVGNEKEKAPRQPLVGFLHTAQVKSTLCLDDDAAWEAVERLLVDLPPPQRSLEPPTALERTGHYVLRKNDGSAFSLEQLGELTRKELLRAQKACERGDCFLRSLAYEEDDPHWFGLRARNPAAQLSVAEHVAGVRDSPYISLSADLSVPLSWALPYGMPVIIVPRWASTTILDPSALEKNLKWATDSDDESDDHATAAQASKPRVIHLAQRSAESCAVGAVDISAVEKLSSGVVAVASGPTILPSPATTELPDIALGRGFPLTARHFQQLSRVPVPGSDKLDFEGKGELRTPADYFSRRSVIALAGPGSSEPSYLLLRMTPNGLALEDSDASILSSSISAVKAQKERLARTMAGGAQQLQRAQHELCAQSSPHSRHCGDVAFYELDVSLSQQRVVMPSLHDYKVGKVPVLLVRWGPDAVSVAAELCRHKATGVPRG